MFLMVGSRSRVSAFALWAWDVPGPSQGLLSLYTSMAFITKGNPFNELSAFGSARL